jgi:hypothetical protein
VHLNSTITSAWDLFDIDAKPWHTITVYRSTDGTRLTELRDEDKVESNSASGDRKGSLTVMCEVGTYIVLVTCSKTRKFICYY